MNSNKLLSIIFITLLSLLLIPQSLMAYEKEIRGISSAITENISAAGKKTVAVVDFTDLQGNMTELGRFLAEELSVDLTLSAKGFEVVDRTHLKSILTEHKLSVTGLVDPNTVKKLGQIAGVDAIVTGTVTPFGDSIRVTCKVIATDTAKVIGASKGDIAKTKAIEELLARGIEAGAPTAPSTGTTALPPQPKAMPKVEINEFTLNARGCKMQGQKVICTIAVVNNASKVRNFAVSLRNPGASILVDDLGNQYTSAAGWFGGKGGESVMVGQDVPSGLPMNLILEYRDVVTTARYVNVVVDFWVGGLSPSKAVLRNIPLTK